LTRVYKNRQACFYQRMIATSDGAKTFTEVTAPKSRMSANSIMPADMSGREACRYFVALCFLHGEVSEVEHLD